MNPGDDDDGTDWFAEAMDYAVGSPRAQDARKAAATRVARETALKEIAARETALKEIRETAAKNKAESAAKVADRLAARIAATSTPTRPADHAAALRAFGIAATAAGTAMGGISRKSGPFDEIYKDATLGRASQPREITADEGFKAILKAVRNSDDPFKSAGEWMTKITHGLAEIINESDEEK